MDLRVLVTVGPRLFFPWHALCLQCKTMTYVMAGSDQNSGEQKRFCSAVLVTMLRGVGKSSAINITHIANARSKLHFTSTRYNLVPYLPQASTVPGRAVVGHKRLVHTCCLCRTHHTLYENNTDGHMTQPSETL